MLVKRSDLFLFLKAVGALLLFSGIFTGMAAAATGTIAPDSIAPGGMFTVSVADVPNNSTVNLQVQGEFAVQPGSAFSFQLTNMTWPVDLGEHNNSTVRLENTVTNKVTWRERDPVSGETEVIVEGLSVQGVFIRNVSDIDVDRGNDDIEPVEEHDVLFEGTAEPDTSTVIATVNVQAKTTKGPNSYSIPIHVNGISTGLVRVSVFVNNQLLVAKTLTVGTPAFTDATLQVTSIPTNAGVFIDGVYAGQTPLFAKVPAGVRTVTIQKAGYYPYQKQITVPDGSGLMIPVYAELTLMPIGVPAPALPGIGPGSSSPGILSPVQPHIPILVGSGGYYPGVIIIPNPPAFPGGVISINPNAIMQRSVPFPFL